MAYDTLTSDLVQLADYTGRRRCSEQPNRRSQPSELACEIGGIIWNSSRFRVRVQARFPLPGWIYVDCD